MNYQNFINQVQQSVSDLLDPEVTLSMQQVRKNNGILYDGLSFYHPSCNLSPIIYLLPFYHQYLNGISLDVICKDILQVYEQHIPHADFDTERFLNFSCISGYIQPKLVHYERNESLLSNIPHRRFYDLAVIYQVILSASDTRYATITVTHQHRIMWDVTEDTLYEIALTNAQTLAPADILDLYDFVDQSLRTNQDSLSFDLPLFDTGERPSMYILTNKRRQNGSSVILYPQLLQKFAQQFAADLILLPSSIHEFIALPLPSHSTPEEMAQFTKMVREVNETQLTDEEVLSDHAYLYSITEDCLFYLREDGTVYSEDQNSL